MWPLGAQQGAVPTHLAIQYHHRGFLFDHKGNKLGKMHTAEQLWRFSSLRFNYLGNHKNCGQAGCRPEVTSFQQMQQ
jgi:hypothetical protein